MKNLGLSEMFIEIHKFIIVIEIKLIKIVPMNKSK